MQQFIDYSGQTFGQYQLIELIGQGGMGSVYRAIQVNLQVERAVKVLPSAFSENPGYVERFTREAETSASLEHPNIVPVFDYGTQRGTSYLVMRLLHGGTLSHRMAQRARQGVALPGLGEVSQMLRQISSALDYAHGRGVIHRDIKDSNVMFDQQGNAYLTDFGIAKLMDATSGLTGSSLTIGTPLYMPPEQWSGGNLTPAADQYALAVMVYQLVVGSFPFDALTPYQLMHKHIFEAAPLAHSVREELPESVGLVLARALSKDPDDRYTHVMAFSRAFDEAINDTQKATTQFFTMPVIVSRPAPRPAMTDVMTTPTPIFTTPLAPSAPSPPVPPIPPALMMPPTSRGISPASVFIIVLLTLILAMGVAIFAFARPFDARADLDEDPFNSPILTEIYQTNVAQVINNSDKPTVTLTPTETFTALLTKISSPTLTLTPTAGNTLDSGALTLATTRITATIITVTANLRSGPGTSFNVVANFVRGTELEVLAQSRDRQWYLIKRIDRNSTAWISASTVRINPTGVAITIAQTQPAPRFTATPTLVIPTHTPLPNENPGVTDRDGDGVPDNRDVCPNQGDRGAGIDSDGCPIRDNDGDGVPNSRDECPNEGDFGFGIYVNGCPIGDGDNDGVSDLYDECPEQGDEGHGVYENGCPVGDGDDDGVSDIYDECPERGDEGYGVGENGCPILPGDSDGDGILDPDDDCVNDPYHDPVGDPCNHDEDGDGVLDEDDDCPFETGRRRFNGCPSPP
ncbi:MAG: protein kinase [Anaerolineae bacterium]|nr:protein kinase [Anaerolineae bacterium]